MEMVRDLGSGNRSKGTPPGKNINAWGRSLYNQWLRGPAITQTFNDEGEQTSNYLRLHTLRSPAAIKETIGWNPDGNFDRVSALGMLMIYREDQLRYLGHVEETPEIDPSDYWIRNYYSPQQRQNLINK
jgi:hypothetical protein